MSQLFVAIFLILLSYQGLAKKSSGTTSVVTSKPSQYVEKKAIGGEDIDDEIRNSRLRASTGSKSEVSIQTDFSFSGGSVYKPLGPARPRLSPGPIVEGLSKITGNVSAKYRLNENNHLNLGTGIGLTSPGFGGQRYQVENPYISYSNVFGAKSSQHVFSVSLVKYSAKELVEDVGLAYEFGFFYTHLVTLSPSGWQAGLVYLFSHEIFREYNQFNKEETLNVAGLYPFVEYEFSDTYSFRTIYRGIMFYSNRKNFNTYKWDEATQSLGVGLTLTRDIYLYPNVQWVWRDIRLDKTNLSLIANINFF